MAGVVQADMVLEKELRVLHLGSQAAEATPCHTEYSLSNGDLQAHPHSDTLHPTMPQLLKQSQTP